MNLILTLTSVSVMAMTTACGASYPVPTQRMADAQSAQRSAKELGAEKDPEAQLHLKLSEEQIAKANTILKDEDNRRADFMLIRAKADAELALAIAHAQVSKGEAQKAIDMANTRSDTNINQGAR